MAHIFSIEDYVGIDQDDAGNYLKQRAPRELRKLRRIALARFERKHLMTFEKVVAVGNDLYATNKALSFLGLQRYYFDDSGFVFFENPDDAHLLYVTLDSQAN
jgi:hypothetical protein